MEFTELAGLIKSRRSIRKWTDKKVDLNLLKQAIELASWAPNGGNQQNWHFYVITNTDIIKAIADAAQNAANLIASWAEGTEFAGAIGEQRGRTSFFRNAPAAIAVATGRYQSIFDKVLSLKIDNVPEARQMYEWRRTANSGTQSIGSVVNNLLLVLHAMGLGAVWMTGPMQVKSQIEKLLNVPGDRDVVAFIPVGYPAENPEPKPRRPLTEICTVI